MMRKRVLAWVLLVMALVVPAQLALAQGLGAQGNGSKAAEDSQPGLLSLDVQQAVWVLVIFVVLVFILYRTAWKNVLAGLKAREDRIRKDIADAESARVRGEQALKDYNAQLATAEAKVQAMFNQAAVDAEKIAAGIRMHAQQEAEEIKERAIREIETSKEQALSEIYEQTANLSTSIAEKILKRSLNADDQRDLVAQGLEQLQTLK